jgi:hypothetical protein
MNVHCQAGDKTEPIEAPAFFQHINDLLGLLETLRDEAADHAALIETLTSNRTAGVIAAADAFIDPYIADG